jgi:TetR/AcrR family transcriptional repressor of nem operon
MAEGLVTTLIEPGVADLLPSRPVARTKAFDPDAALDRAMETFWKRGYEATSTQELERALGINRSSIYATFGSKGELYSRALERYANDGPGGLRTGALDGPLPLRDRVGALLWRLIDEDLDPERARGCFAAYAAFELAPRDPAVRRLVTRSFTNARAVFHDALLAARDSSELSHDADIEALASLFVAIVEGLHVVALGTGDRRFVAQAIDGALLAL